MAREIIVNDVVAFDLAYAFLREASDILVKRGHKDLATEIAKPLRRINTLRLKTHKKFAALESDDAEA